MEIDEGWHEEPPPSEAPAEIPQEAPVEAVVPENPPEPSVPLEQPLVEVSAALEGQADADVVEAGLNDKGEIVGEAVEAAAIDKLAGEHRERMSTANLAMEVAPPEATPIGDDPSQAMALGRERSEMAIKHAEFEASEARFREMELQAVADLEAERQAEHAHLESESEVAARHADFEAVESKLREEELLAVTDFEAEQLAERTRNEDALFEAMKRNESEADAAKRHAEFEAAESKLREEELLAVADFEADQLAERTRNEDASIEAMKRNEKLAFEEQDAEERRYNSLRAETERLDTLMDYRESEVEKQSNYDAIIDRALGRETLSESIQVSPTRDVPVRPTDHPLEDADPLVLGGMTVAMMLKNVTEKGKK